MRLKMEIDELTTDQWEHAQKILQAVYDIPDGASRACLVLSHKGEERHVEMPASKVSGFLMGLSLVPALRQMTDAVKMARAALTPDDPDLPRGFEPEYRSAQCSPECEAQDDDRPHLLDCPIRRRRS
jgi:hypothetical protein